MDPTVVPKGFFPDASDEVVVETLLEPFGATLNVGRVFAPLFQGTGRKSPVLIKSRDVFEGVPPDQFCNNRLKGFCIDVSNRKVRSEPTYPRTGGTRDCFSY